MCHNQVPSKFNLLLYLGHKRWWLGTALGPSSFLLRSTIARATTIGVGTVSSALGLAYQIPLIVDVVCEVPTTHSMIKLSPINRGPGIAVPRGMIVSVKVVPIASTSSWSRSTLHKISVEDWSRSTRFEQRGLISGCRSGGDLIGNRSSLGLMMYSRASNDISILA
jgi:hypothetical protein